jgi:hypothetical protein
MDIPWTRQQTRQTQKTEYFIARATLNLAAVFELDTQLFHKPVAKKVVNEWFRHFYLARFVVE